MVVRVRALVPDGVKMLERIGMTTVGQKVSAPV